MIAWMISLWANPLAKKFIVGAGAIMAIFWFLRVYGNRQYARGEMAGRQHMAAEIERQKRAEWQEREDAIAREAEIVAGEKRAVEAAIEQISRDRMDLSRQLRDGLASIQRERIRDYESVAAVSDDRLWDAIREISGELAADP